MKRFYLFPLLALAACSATKASDASTDAGTAADVASSDALSDASGVGDAGQDTSTGKYAFPECDPAATTQRVSFVHVNDLHASYAPQPDGVSPIARIIGYLKASRTSNPYTVFTDGGDAYEKGSVAEQISKGLSTREIMRAMKFDVRVIGNHDYAWSKEEVLANSQDPNARVLSSNMQYIGDDPTQWQAVEYVALQIGCVKVGFFGFTSGPWDSTDSPIPGPFYPEFPATYEYAKLAQAIVDKHRKEVDLLIAVDHIGLSEDQALAKAVPGLDAVLSGHSHSFTLMPSDDGKSTPVVQSGAFCAHVVRLDLDVDLKSKQVTKVGYDTAGLGPDSNTPVDEAINQTVADIVRQHAPEWDKPLVQIENGVASDGAALVAMHAELEVFQADAALVDVHTTWSLWLPGPLTQQNFVDMFKVEREPAGTPGFNAAYTAKILGSELQKLTTLDPLNWVFQGPTTIEPTKTYKIALQKRTALNPTHMPGGAVVTEPKAEMEMWEVLDKYARVRGKACKYLDSENVVEGCQ